MKYTVSNIIIGAVSLALLLALVVHAAPVGPSTATSEYQSPLAATDGWCYYSKQNSVLNDLMSFAPARLTAARKSQIRWIKVQNAGTWGTLSATPLRVCTSLGAAGAGSSLTCDFTAGTAFAVRSNAGILANGDSMTLLVSRFADGTIAPINFLNESNDTASVGTAGVILCATVGF